MSNPPPPYPPGPDDPTQRPGPTPYTPPATPAQPWSPQQPSQPEPPAYPNYQQPGTYQPEHSQQPPYPQQPYQQPGYQQPGYQQPYQQPGYQQGTPQQWSPTGPPPSGPPGGKSRTGLVVAVVAGLVLLLGASIGLTLLVTNSDGDDDSASDPTSQSPSPSTEEPTESASSAEPTESTITEEPTQTTPASPSGDPVSPGATGLALGTPATIGDFTVTLRMVNKDADQAIKNANQFNEPPKMGRYVLASWEVTYHGSGKGDASFDIRTLAKGGDSGLDYNDYDCGSVVPNNILGDSELKSGETKRFDTCFDVKISDLDGLQVGARDAEDYSADPTYWTP